MSCSFIQVTTTLMHAHSSTHPCYHCKKKKEKKKFRAINHTLTAESVGLPSPDSSERKIAAVLQVMLLLICLQSHEPNRNTRWMKREHLNASAEGLAGEGADSSKVSKWIPLRHLREEWRTFFYFFHDFMPIFYQFSHCEFPSHYLGVLFHLLVCLLRTNLSETDAESGHKKAKLFSVGLKMCIKNFHSLREWKM